MTPSYEIGQLSGTFLQRVETVRPPMELRYMRDVADHEGLDWDVPSGFFQRVSTPGCAKGGERVSPAWTKARNSSTSRSMP